MCMCVFCFVINEGSRGKRPYLGIISIDVLIELPEAAEIPKRDRVD